MRLPEERPARSVILGLGGGLAGTVLMDIIIVVTFLAIGEPWDSFFVAVGEELGDGPVLGVGIHDMIGMTVGVVFSVAVSTVDAFRVTTIRKGLVFGVLVGAITIPLGCVPMAIWLGESIIEVVAFSTIPHLVYGSILGLVVGWGNSVMRVAESAET